MAILYRQRKLDVIAFVIRTSVRETKRQTGAAKERKAYGAPGKDSMVDPPNAPFSISILSLSL